MDEENTLYTHISVSHGSKRESVNVQKRRWTAVPIIFVLLVSNLIGFLIITPLPNASAEGIESRVEPVVVSGSNITGFIGTPIGEIWVYAYIGGLWVQIPFQIDERNDLNGSYFYDAQDSLLDGNDEIVFMPSDCGDEATTTTRVPDTDIQRYEIMIMDPLDLSVKYAYIYRSSNILKEFSENYVDYEPISHTINAADYTLGFNDSLFGLMDEMSIKSSIGGDNTDILDRSKFRFERPAIPFSKSHDEDDFTYELVGFIDGPVRVILQVSSEINETDFNSRMDNTVFAYKSYSNTNQTIYANTSIDYLRISSDFMSTSIPMTYYDSVGNDLTIDGSSDTPSSTEVPTWTEVTGSHGTIVAVCNYTKFEGTQFLFYVDDSGTIDPPEEETGQYGNYGFHVNNPINRTSLYSSFYFLPPNQEKIGSTYANYTDKSIIISAASQIVDPTPPPEISDVTPLPDPQEVPGSVNISAVITDNLDELYRAWVNIMDPEGGSVGNFTMAFDSNTNRYYYERTYDAVGTYQFVIWANDTSNNWNSEFGQFVIEDTTYPTITDVTQIPNPQEVEGYLNISAVVSDVVLENVSINITDPNGGTVGNFTMAFDSSNNRYYDNRIYGIVGDYQFIIWANDTSNNLNHSTGQFTIQDTTSPTANAGLDQEVSQGTTVVFDASGSFDNVDLVSYKWTFIDVTMQILNGANPSYTFSNIGDFEVTLNVTDAAGNWDTDIMFVNVSGIATTGSISGTVRDEDGNAIEGATVTVQDTSYEATTNETGYYMIQNIPPGIYNLTVTKSGYDTKTITGVTVSTGQDTSNEDFALKKVAEGESDNGAGNYVWIILIIVIVVILLVFLMMTLTKSKKEKEVGGEIGFECPVCGASIKPDMTSCPACGVTFSVGEEAEVVVEVPPSEEEAEGVPTSLTAEGAEEEGVEVKALEEEYEAEPSREIIIPKDEVQEVIAEEPEKEIGEYIGEEIEDTREGDLYMCPSCGAFISPSTTICSICGFDFEVDEEEEESEGETEEDQKEELEEEDRDEELGEEEEEEQVEEQVPKEEMIEPEVTRDTLLGESEAEEKEEEKIEAKEIMQMFKEELKPPESDKEMKAEYETLTKEIDKILDEKEGKETKETEEDEETEEEEEIEEEEE